MSDLRDLLQVRAKGAEVREYFSPGRINLIGEHVDYKITGGKVMPAAISLGITAFAAKSESIIIFSKNFSEQGWIETKVDFNTKYEPKRGFLNMILGVYSQLKNLANKVGGVVIAMNSTIPVASGLSSSAAICVLIFTVLNDLYSLGLTPTQIALSSQKVENEYIGLSSGIMDQFIIANGCQNKIMYLDTDSLKYEQVDLPKSAMKFYIVNTCKPRELATSAYNQRVKELHQVMDIFHANKLDFAILSDANRDEYLDLIPDNILRRRFKHVLTEIRRVNFTRSCLSEITGPALGQLINESHASLRDDYETSCEEADWIHYNLLSKKNIYGSRIIGAGFGGCMLVIGAPSSSLKDFDFSQEYQRKFGHGMEVYEFTIEDGTKRIQR